MAEHRCPSARCEDGALLLGIVGPDGEIAYLGNGLIVDQAFVDRASQGRAPEKRFRFSSSCVECKCRQWTGDRCGVIDKVVALAEEMNVQASQEGLPDCGIRQSCRWFHQSGVAACRTCALVITDTLTAEEPAAPA